MYRQTPLLNAINHRVEGQIVAWCTPSIHPETPQVIGLYQNDISVSFHNLGNPSCATGIFGQAQQLAADFYEADQTLFSVNGSTGSNFIVLKALKRQLKNVRLVAARNVHKSICVALEENMIDVTYLPFKTADKLPIFLPNSLEEIQAAIKAARANVLLLTNPTYEGLSLQLDSVIKKLHKKFPDLIVFVDEAWGAHFQASSHLPVSAMAAGADICVQSTHKQGSSLQQTGMIHWQADRIDSDVLRDTYKDLVTTSPSYHLLASLDGARYFLQTRGKATIEELINKADVFRQKLAQIPGVNVWWPEQLVDLSPTVAACDSTKILVQIKNKFAHEIASELEHHYGVVVEKAEGDTLLLIFVFQNDFAEIDHSIQALSDVIGRVKTRSFKIVFPLTQNNQVLQPWEVNLAQTESLPLVKAVDRVCAENVVPYPPGIPLITKGELISQVHLDFIQTAEKLSQALTLLMHDPSGQTIQVVKDSAYET